IGLLKLIQAGKLAPIEEALAALGGSGSPRPAKPTPAKKPAPQALAPSSASTSPARATANWRDRIHAALIELGMPFTADAGEHSEVTESNNELHFLTPSEFSLAMNEKDILKVVEKVGGRP